jgi:hypothetical protein
VIFPPTSTAASTAVIFCSFFTSNVYCSDFPPTAIFTKFENLFMTVKLAGDSSDILPLDDWLAEGCSDNIEVE